MKQYRERLKECPALYKAYKDKEAARGRQYRASLSDAKKKDQREKTRLLVQKWRDQQKLKMNFNMNQATTSKPKHSVSVKTRVQKKQQEKWRINKQKQRANMTAQKKRRIHEKRRAKYNEKKKQITRTKKEKPIKESSIQEDGYKTEDAKRKAVYRAKQTLPSEQKKIAQVMSKLTESASPRKRKALDQEGFFTPAVKKRHIDFVKQYQKEMQETKMKRSRYHLNRRRHIASIAKITTKERTEFGFSWGFAYKASQIDGIWQQKKNKNAMDESAVGHIQQFFKKSGISTCLPNKKLVSTKTMEPRRVLKNSLKQTYLDFREENPECVVSFPKFVSLRPKSVKTMQKNYFNGCLCEYCANLEMKVKALKKIVPKVKGKESEFVINSRYDLLKMTLCARKEGAKFNERGCIDRMCSKCGPVKIETYVKSALHRRQGTKSNTIEWSRWENQTYKDKHGEKKTRIMLRLKQGTVNIFLKELVDEVVPYSLHIHVASWQHNQFNQLVKDVPHNWVVFCMENSENYQCLYQDEAQSAHWSHDQATLFSIVAYSKCPACKEIMHESLVFVSDEKQHDSHAVHHYVTLANQHLLETRGLTIEREIHFSDGASSQFKSKTPFADVAHSVDDYGFPCEKHFFGSRHGKGPCDGEFGVLKRSVSMAVLSRRAVVRNAQEFYEHCSLELTKPKVEPESSCCHSRRTFFYVQESEIPPKCSRSNRINAKPVSQTRKLHAIKPSVESKIALSKRLLSCFCKFCVGEQGDKCSNITHVDDWQPEGRENRKGSMVKKENSKTKKGISKVKKESAKVKNKNPNVKKESPKIKQASEAHVKVGKDQTEENETVDDPESINVDKLILECSTFSDLTKAVKKLDIEELPKISARTFCNTGCVVDNDSLPLVPGDIPLKPNSQLFPCAIYGDGNCLPRSASVLVYGSEENFKEMRKRMVIELTRNEAYYLDKAFMKKGKQDSAQDDVPKSFAHLSSLYMGEQLTKSEAKRLYEKEVLEIRKSGAYMGLWQIACLANILRCPVVSVCPTYGTHTVRKDMHRVFYPFNEEFHASQPVFIMWTSLGGIQKEEKDFSLNHFDVLMPMTNSMDADLADYMVDDSYELSDSANSGILKIIAEKDEQETLKTASNTAELPDSETFVPPEPEPGNTPSPETSETTSHENDETVKQQVQNSEPSANPVAEKDLPSRTKTELQLSAEMDLPSCAETNQSPCAEMDFSPSTETDLQAENASSVTPVAEKDLPSRAKMNLQLSAETDFPPSVKTNRPPSAEMDLTSYAENNLQPKNASRSDRSPVLTPYPMEQEPSPDPTEQESSPTSIEKEASTNCKDQGTGSNIMVEQQDLTKQMRMSQATNNSQALSMRLSEVLADIGLDKRTVKKRRIAEQLLESSERISIELRGYNVTGFSFGSQIEGTTTRGLKSDRDRLYCLNPVKVIQDLSEWIPGVANYMMIQDDTVEPGYCLLQLLDHNDPLPATLVPDQVLSYFAGRILPDQHFRDKSGRILLKNTYFPVICDATDAMETSPHKGVRHGPAHTTTTHNQGISNDTVLAFFCQSWPLQASQWIEQQGVGHWPSDDMKIYCSNTVCFVVGVGRKGSVNEELEWRISTSLAERRLMFSLNITQIRCYVLMKMLVKTFINPYYEDAISSFMCKTVLFQTIAITHPTSNFWRKRNLISCLTKCLSVLYNCVLNESCPHFIIPGNNLMAGHISHEFKPHILEMLRNIINSKGKALLQIKCDKLGAKLQVNNTLSSQFIFMDGVIPGLRLLDTTHFKCYIEICLHYISKSYCSYEVAIQTLLKYIFKLNSISNRGHEMDQRACTLLTPWFYTTLGSVLASRSIQQYNCISENAKDWTSMGLNTDVASSKLKKASMFYCIGDSQTTEIVLKDIEGNYDQTRVEPICICHAFPNELTSLPRTGFNIISNDHNEEALQYIAAFCVRYLPCEIHCVPHELRYEMFRSTKDDLAFRYKIDCWMDLAVADSLPYLYFLQYKTYSYLGKQEDKQRALSNLLKTIDQEPNLGHRETALNLLGQCMEREDRVNDASNCYILSLSLRERNNAANIHICRLLSKLVTDSTRNQTFQ
ncbi:uncharacterized protein LOC123559695 [Mercenaria mercenaria]|uniref:uncharacterized protein LOC123559695 n=1 Tax=Mercenaria mercenaria TaxID=6596 RepID=UPI00234E9E2D|nr:uncharacterized protein LOC123559695 [Mercenaria mercenaria]